MLKLADRIGHQHIPVNAAALDIHGFLRHDGVHHDLIKLVVRKLYKANHCGHLDAEVTWRPSMKCVIAIRNNAIQAESTDVEQVQLLDDVLDGIGAYLPSERETSAVQQQPSKPQSIRIYRYPAKRIVGS